MAYRAKKNGKHNGMQTYRCSSCLKSFQNKKRIQCTVKKYGGCMQRKDKS